MSIYVQCLSSRFLEVLTVMNLIQTSRRLFHSLTTRTWKNFCPVLHRGLNTLKWCPCKPFELSAIWKMVVALIISLPLSICNVSVRSPRVPVAPSYSVWTTTSELWGDATSPDFQCVRPPTSKTARRSTAGILRRHRQLLHHCVRSLSRLHHNRYACYSLSIIAVAPAV